MILKIKAAFFALNICIRAFPLAFKTQYDLYIKKSNKKRKRKTT